MKKTNIEYKYTFKSWIMKYFAFLILLISTNVNAWGGPGFGPGFGWGGGWAGPAYNGYGGYGYMYPYPPIQYPAFNYQTTIIQQPIVREAPPAPVIINEQPRVEYRDRTRYRPCDDECVKRYYSK